MIKKINLDVTIIVVLLCFMGISTALIYSATSGTRYDGMHMTHLYTYIVLFLTMLVFSLFNYRPLIYPMIYFFYVVGVGLQVLVLFYGVEQHGATRWLDLKFLPQFQPSELMKILLVMAIARLLAKRNGAPLRFIKDVVPIMVLTFIPFFLIFKQPDLGTSLVFIAICIGMLWIGNIRKMHVVWMAVALVAVVLTLVSLYFLNQDLFSKIIRPHQMDRIQVFLDPESDPNKRYHLDNAMAAISIGQLSGYGWGKGPYVQTGRVPVTYSDSIYVVVGEEFGFIGSSILLLLFFVLIYRMIYIALECEDLYSRYFIVGVATMFSFQIFVNIGMHLGLLPLTGIALPFISYGGSSLMLNMLSVGLVLSIRNHESRTADR